MGIHVLILQHREGRDCIRHRRGDSAGYQVTVRSSSCLVNSLCVEKKKKNLQHQCCLSHVYQVDKNELCSLEELHAFFKEDAPLAYSLKHDSYPLPILEQLTSSFCYSGVSEKLENISLFPNSYLIKLNSNLFISSKLCLVRENVTVMLSVTGDITLFSKLATPNC